MDFESLDSDEIAVGDSYDSSDFDVSLISEDKMIVLFYYEDSLEFDSSDFDVIFLITFSYGNVIPVPKDAHIFFPIAKFGTPRLHSQN